MKRFLISTFAVAAALAVSGVAQAAGKGGLGNVRPAGSGSQGNGGIKIGGFPNGNNSPNGSNFQPGKLPTIQNGNKNFPVGNAGSPGKNFSPSNGNGNGNGHGLQKLTPKGHVDNYHQKHGVKCNYGYCYKGNHHCHWTYKCWYPSCGCYCYWCPYVCVYYYYCAPDCCWYPISYCPYGTYQF